jgi:N-acyl-D-amino-acid deacylase
MAQSSAGKDPDILLKGGLIVDGSGGAPYTANLLIKAGRVGRISPRSIRTTGVVIDCAGKVVAPGFIDAHSHLDWHIPLKGRDELKYPFLAQGITTVIAGNCGLSAAGFRESSPWQVKVSAMLAGTPSTAQKDPPALWDTVGDYLDQLESAGTSQNIALLVGHGSTRASIRGNDSSPLHPYETMELLRLLERALDQGAKGVSLGLQHVPGTFARPDEIREVARLVKKKGRVLAVHPRAFAPAPPGKSVPALTEVIDIARATGVRLQISHLFFAGPRPWHSAEAGLAAIDTALKDGLDVRFDVVPYTCLGSVIGVVLPSWFLARGPSGYSDAAALRRLKRDLRSAERKSGFGLSAIQVTNTGDPELAELNGRFLNDIARIRRVSPIDALVDVSRRSGGQAKVLLHHGGTDRVQEALLRHPASLFSTDAWIERTGEQNPAAYGAFPRFLQLAREKRLLPVEEAVRKMTGAAAERFDLAGRGRLAEGAAADITVFDWENVRDNTAAADSRAAPEGIEYVIVNGKKVIGSRKKEHPLNAGVPIR